MQTRRKSLNLGDLGVIAPKRARATFHPSPPDTVIEGEEPPVKRSKRSHASPSPSSSSPPPAAAGLMSPPRTAVIRLKEDPSKAVTELSPPPSPVAAGSKTSKVDTEGIRDDIVVATIEQLEKTGNRPHLVKELVATLGPKLQCVDKSANPSALISSRLTAYLHRSWPAISPCPLAKDLSPVHPRRLYFYLTTTPHQPIPEVAEPVPKANRIISPSLSSASAADEEEGDDRFMRQRQALSPSPEVDLSTPELDEDSVDAPPTPGEPFSSRNSLPHDRTSFTHPRRAASPPLENEERDFKQTASALYEQAKARRNSQSSPHIDINMDRDAPDSASVTMSIEQDESEEVAARKNSEAAAALFGACEHIKMLDPQHMEFSSPLLQPQIGMLHGWGGDDEPMAGLATAIHRESHDTALSDADFGWGDARHSPELVELDEIDDMFDAY